jgi:hypothetical protein
MRLLQLLASSEHAEPYKKLTEKLKDEYGEPVITQRSGIVPMEKDAWEKLRALHGSN